MNSCRARIKSDDELKAFVETLLAAQAGHYSTPESFFQRHLDLFCDRPRDRWKPQIKDSIIGANLLLIEKAFSKLPEHEWYPDNLHQVLESVKAYIEQQDLESCGEKADKKLVSIAFYHYVRWALTGGRPGPRLTDLMVYLGRQNTLKRLISAREDAMITMERGEIESSRPAEAIQLEDSEVRRNIPH